jgi:hypothetical protein
MGRGDPDSEHSPRLGSVDVRDPQRKLDVIHVWTAPSRQGVWTRMTRSGCGHVSGLLARPWPLAQMRSASGRQTSWRLRRAVESRGVLPPVGPTDRHLASLPFPRGTGARSGHRQGWAIGCPRRRNSGCPVCWTSCGIWWRSSNKGQHARTRRVSSSPRCSRAKDRLGRRRATARLETTAAWPAPSV